jgi:hypothetical protein
LAITIAPTHIAAPSTVSFPYSPRLPSTDGRALIDAARRN